MTAIAVDFGSSNTLLGQWNPVTQAPEILTLTAISTPNTPLIPSVLYFRDAAKNRLAIGHQVVGSGYKPEDSGYFDQIKRSLLVEDAPEYLLNGIVVNPQLVGKLFLQQVFKQVRSQNITVTDLIFTAPVQAYERYLRWLESCSPDLMDASDFEGDIRIIDEPTASALGYAIAVPNSLVLVIDFGGGTLDICLVKTPKSENLNEWGEVIGDRYLYTSEAAENRTKESNQAKQVEVIAKTGLPLGGTDIDRWLLEHWLNINELNHELNQASMGILLSLMEQIKIALSIQELATQVYYDPENLQPHDISYDRIQLEQILKAQGFYRILQNAIDEVVNRAIAKGILRMDIKHIVLVGGSTLIPSVQALITKTFPRSRIYSDRPFEAVLFGALLLNQGLGIRDHLFHDYAIRYLPNSCQNSEWQYQPLFFQGQAYPTKHPFALILRASQADQAQIEVVIGELEKRSSESVEVIFQGDRLVSAVSKRVTTKFLPLIDSETPQLVIPLQPLGQIGIDRLQLFFQISDRRQLVVTVIDLLTKIELFTNLAIAELH